ncbi:unnamed protein product [Spirodela intermedia]|uniref:CRAL-TRIO domain-containing protein n=1 Tax=Spirodela intermedia TaxID=51605 RepID=A0A7I8JFZ7_SPIIN|nr:unnamed protein product [Spirodela intermedia]CAA6668423.1 unnamed protein product [Spirodela intermedia]
MAEEGREPEYEAPAAAAAAAREGGGDGEEGKEGGTEAEGVKEGRKRGSGIPLAAYFKEESNVVADLEDSQKVALDELKQLLRVALAAGGFPHPPPPPPPPVVQEENKVAEKAEEPPPATPEKVEEPPPASSEKVEEPPTAAGDSKVEEDAADKAKTVVREKEEIPEEPPKLDDDSARVEKELVAAVTVAEEKSGGVDEGVVRAVDVVEEDLVPVARVEVFLWGVPLLGDERSDTILLKFLRARDFKVKDALEMLKNTVIWRKEFGIEGLLEEDLGMPELEKVVFMQGHDKEGHPICYNVYGEFQDKDLYHKVFTDEEKRKRFLRWRIQFLEKGIRRHLDFITDLKNSPGLGKWELRQATKQALAVFINVPWWYLAFNRMINPFFTQRTKSKFVFAGPSKSSEALFEFIAPEQVPVRYGGLSKENDVDFCTSDAATEVFIKPSTKHTIDIPASESCVLVWELRVLGWDVSCGAEFKTRKFTSVDEPLLKNSYRVEEPGKVVLTIDNSTFKKKKLLYRSKATIVADSS